MSDTHVWEYCNVEWCCDTEGNKEHRSQRLRAHRAWFLRLGMKLISSGFVTMKAVTPEVTVVLSNHVCSVQHWSHGHLWVPERTKNFLASCPQVCAEAVLSNGVAPATASFPEQSLKNVISISWPRNSHIHLHAVSSERNFACFQCWLCCAPFLIDTVLNLWTERL